MNAFQRGKEALVSRFGTDWGRRAPFAPVYWRTALVVLGLVALALFILRDHGLLDHARLRGTLDSLEERNRRLETQIDWYRQRNRRLQAGDPFTLEEEARRMGMARPGEEVYRVVLPDDTTAKREE
jgi:cell division protein FtsB